MPLHRPRASLDARAVHLADSLRRGDCRGNRRPNMSGTRSRHSRALAAGALSAALLSTGTAGAVAATGTPAPKPSTTHTGMPSMKPSRTATVMGSITVSADRKAVKVGSTVVFTGRVKGIKAGSTLVLQHRHNGKWTTLRTTATAN